MTKAKVLRIKAKLVRAAALLAEANEIVKAEAAQSSVANVRDIREVTGAAADAGERILADWAALESKWLRDAESASRYARELEEYGECTKCGTGAAASHTHCGGCGWALYTFGSRVEQCHNPDCDLFEQHQDGIRYSDKREAVV